MFNLNDTIAKIITALANNPIISGQVGNKIYSVVPDDAPEPYIWVDITSSGSFGSKCKQGLSLELRVSNYTTQPSIQNLNILNDAIISVLDRKEADLGLSGVLHLQFNGFYDVFKDKNNVGIGIVGFNLVKE